MTENPPSGVLKYPAGNVLVTRAVQQFPPFLLRNLAASLDHHGKRATHSSGDKTSSPTNLDTKIHLDRSNWCPPSHSFLDELEKMRMPKLRIDVKGLKPLGRAETYPNSDDPANSTRKRRKVIDCRCRVEVVVYELNKDKPPGSKQRVDAEPVLKEVREDGKLQGRRYDDGYFHFEIELIKPFSINMGQLGVPQEGRHAHMDMGLASAYEIVIKIRVLGKDNIEDVLAHIHGAEVPVSGPMEPIIARWTSLPRCPSGRIKTFQMVRGRKVVTDYGLKIDMSWGKENGLNLVESPLSLYNSEKRRQARASLLTPTSTPSPSIGATRQVGLEYMFSDRSVNVQGYRCILCTTTREFPSLPRLQQHLQTWHSNHNEVFEVTEEDEYTVKVVMETEARGRGSRQRKPLIRPELWSPGQEEIWLAPLKPFYLDNADGHSWEHSGTLDRMSTSTVDHVKPKALKDIVLELGPRQKQKFIVPPNPPDNANGPRRYFSSKSKRVLEPGELLSESDDEVSADWMEHVRNDKIDALDHLTPEMKTFYKSINTHLEKERVAADMFLSDAIVRWVHRSRSRELLANDAIRAIFEDWLKSTEEYISEEVMEYCLNKAKNHSIAPSEETSAAPSRRRSVCPDSELMDITSDDLDGVIVGDEWYETQLSDIAMQKLQPARRNGQCICLASPEWSDESILCNNPFCPSPEFHWKCMGFKKKPKLEEKKFWGCPSCCEALFPDRYTFGKGEKWVWEGTFDPWGEDQLDLLREIFRSGR